jgi:hypothetical protein
MTEDRLLDRLNKEFDFNLSSTSEDVYCRWDGYSDKYLVELKCRNKHYNTQMIEYQKLDAVKSEADKTNREFLYCVHTPDGVYIFNISKLCSENYNFNWENKSLPNKSKIGSKMRWIPKKVGYIDVNDSEFNISM